MLTVALNSVESPQETSTGTWAVCSPKTVGDFSAAAYYFGRELHKRLGVPVGVDPFLLGRFADQRPGPVSRPSGRNLGRRGWSTGRRCLPRIFMAHEKEYAKAKAAWDREAAEAKAPWPGDAETAVASAVRPVEIALHPRPALQRHDRPAGPSCRRRFDYQGESNAGWASKLYGLQLRR